MENKYYVILSKGAYSDYSPEYFVGPREITQAEFSEKAQKTGDFVIEEFTSLPERKHEHTSDFCCKRTQYGPTEKYWPESGRTAYRPDGSRFMELMRAWIKQEGFVELPDGIPEINVEYSDFPTTKNPTP